MSTTQTIGEKKNQMIQGEERIKKIPYNLLRISSFISSVFYYYLLPHSLFFTYGKSRLYGFIYALFQNIK